MIQSSTSQELSYDRYYVFLKDGYDSLQFVTSVSVFAKKWYNVQFDYIGGQNKAIIVMCKENFFRRTTIAKMVKSYVRFPRISRIDNELIHSISTDLRDNEDVEISVKYKSSKPTNTISQVSTITLSTFQAIQKEPLSTIHLFLLLTP